MKRKTKAAKTSKPVNRGFQPSRKLLKLLNFYKEMPPKSEVIKWLLTDSEAGRILFLVAIAAKVIRYDSDTRKWVGSKWRNKNAR